MLQPGIALTAESFISSPPRVSSCAVDERLSPVEPQLLLNHRAKASIHANAHLFKATIIDKNDLLIANFLMREKLAPKGI